MKLWIYKRDILKPISKLSPRIFYHPTEESMKTDGIIFEVRYYVKERTINLYST